MSSKPVESVLRGLLDRYSIAVDDPPDRTEPAASGSARSYFLATVAERRYEVSSYSRMLDTYHGEENGAGGDKLSKTESSTPRYGRAVHRQRLGSSEKPKPPSTPLSTISMNSPSNSSTASKGTTFKDGQLLRSTPPRHVLSRRSVESSEKHRASVAHINAKSPCNRFPSVSKAIKASPASTASSPLLRRAESRRRHKASSLTPPKKTTHAPSISFGTIDESLELEPDSSLDTFGSLELLFSASSEGTGLEDEVSVAPSVLSTASITSALSTGTMLSVKPSGAGKGSDSKPRSNLDRKIRSLATRRGKAIENLDHIKSSEVLRKKTSPDEEAGANSLLSGISNRNSQSGTFSSSGVTKEETISVLSNVISLLAEKKDSERVQTAPCRRQVYERLQESRIHSSTGEKKSSRADVIGAGVIGAISEIGRYKVSPKVVNSKATEQANPDLVQQETPTVSNTISRGRSTCRARTILQGRSVSQAKERGRSISRSRVNFGRTSDSNMSGYGIQLSSSALPPPISTRPSAKKATPIVSSTTSRGRSISRSNNTIKGRSASQFKERGRSTSRPRANLGSNYDLFAYGDEIRPPSSALPPPMSTKSNKTMGPLRPSLSTKLSHAAKDCALREPPRQLLPLPKSESTPNKEARNIGASASSRADRRNRRSLSRNPPRPSPAIPLAMSSRQGAASATIPDNLSVCSSLSKHSSPLKAKISRRRRSSSMSRS